MAHVERITVYPVKALDGVALQSARVLAGGTLERDREFALFDADGEVINGKRTAAVHELDASFDPETGVLTVEAPDGEAGRFDLDGEGGRDRAAAWFGAYFDPEVSLRRDDSLGFVDRRGRGPSVVSTATLRAVASWFDGLTVAGARRRLRANVEVGGVPAFWEDRFVGRETGFLAGEVRFEDATPCGRCVVPARDPDTGEPIDGFRERFVEKRRETFPEFADRSAFDHYFAAMVVTRVPEADRGRTLRVGDPVSVPGA